MKRIRKICKNCSSGSDRGDGRYKCENKKIFGCFGDDPDGADEFEAAEWSFGPNFGCIHFEKGKTA
jgi:hypothetical protein